MRFNRLKLHDNYITVRIYFFNNIFQGQVFGDNLRNKVTGEQNNQMTLPEFVHLFVRL